MGLSKVSIGIFSIACFICLTNGFAIKTGNQKVDDTSKSASKTFGIKTVTRQTTHSNNGVVTREFKQTQITTGNVDAFPGSTGSQEQFSSIENTQGGNQNQNFPDTAAVDHSSGLDDIVHGLLPLDDAKPVQFGTRLGSNAKQSDCGIKRGCSAQISVSGGNSFGQINTESNQEQLPQKVDHQDEQTAKSSFEQKDVGNTQTQEQSVDQGQQQPENVFGTNFDGQYEQTLRNIGQGDQFVDDIKVPVVDTQFPEQGDGLTDFEAGNIAHFGKVSGIVEEQPANQQQPESPLDFGYVEQQSQGNSQDVSGVYETSPVDQQNVNFQEQSQTADQARNFEFNQENFQYQDGSSVNVDHNSNFAFQQNTGFQEPFVPQPQVSNEFQQQFVPQSQVSNENNYNFQDNTQDFFLSDPIEALRYNVPGNPGEDYPIFYKVPETSFQCNQQPFAAGIYGDMDAQCQVFHFCTESGGQNSFLCPNGTVFNQQYFVCDWWYNYNCSDTPSFYNLNAQLYWDFDSFEPTQIITGTGIGSSEEQQFNNAATFQDNVNSQQFSGSIPEQVQFQTRVSHSGQSQVQTTSTNQQVQSSVQLNGVDSYAEKRQDVNNVRTSFTQQSSTAQNTNLAQQTVDTSGHDFDTHLGQPQTGDFHTNNEQKSSISVPETHSGSFSQQEESSFQQNRNFNRPEVTSFGGSLSTQAQENVNSGDFSVQEKSSQHDLPSTSSDPRRGWKPDSDSGTRYPDQSSFVQQHVDDQQQFHSNDQSISNVASDQTNSVQVSLTQDVSHNNQVSQEFYPTESSNVLSGQNINTDPQSEIQQQHVQIPLEVSARSDQDSNIESFEHSDVSHNEDFTTQSPLDVGQQQNNIDSTQDVSFKREAVFSSFNQDSVNQEQSSFDNSEAVSDQPNLLDVILPETFEELDQDSQSPRGGDDEVVNQDKQIDEAVRVADAFDGQQMIDAIQDAVNYDDIIDGFRSRNVAFMNVATTPEPFNTNQRVYENRPAQVHALSFQQNSNQNVNINPQFQTPTPNFQQENIDVDDIYSIMRGSLNNFEQQNGQQRLSFRPYGQNLDTGTNNNSQEQKQNQNSVSHNTGVQQNINQEIREKVIFPDEQNQGNAQNQWWLNTQNNENIPSVQITKQQEGNTEARNQNVNTHISQSHLNVDVPSKENVNVPNIDRQVQSHNIVNSNQPQNQFQSGINQPQFQNQNIQPEFHNLNNQQNIQSQHQFQTVDDQSHFNGNNQPESQNLNNQQTFQAVKGQNRHQNPGNQQVFRNDNNQQSSGNQRQIQNVNNQQQFQGQNQFHNSNNQQQFQEERQFQNIQNQQQFHERHQFQNVNNQQQFQNVNNQQQFQEQHQFQNVNNQQQFHNVNNQQQLQEQHQNKNINVQQHFVDENMQFDVHSVNNQQHFADADTEHAPVQKFEQITGVEGSSPQDRSQTQNSAEFNSRRPTAGNVHQNQGVKGHHSQQNLREARNGYNFPRPNLQTINANDGIIYSQNAPRSVESAISYNGWKPIVRY